MPTSEYYNLYEGEEIFDAFGPPVLVKYFQGLRDQPLLVLVPGGAHCGRIYYGGHTGGRDEDFLVHWLVRQGFGCLAISYPIALGRPVTVKAAAAPAYSKESWGQQSAAICAATIQKYDLSDEVVLLAWSMGGRVVEPFTRFARTEHNLNVALFIGLAATPSVNGMYSQSYAVNQRQNELGYRRSAETLQIFWDQVRERPSCNEGGLVFDHETYLNDYTGTFPIVLSESGLAYSGSREDGAVFVSDINGEGRISPPFGTLPITLAIQPDSVTDLNHALYDQTNWMFFTTGKLVADINKGKPAWLKTDEKRWKNMVTLVHSAPIRLRAKVVPGNHFFFVGEPEARQTAQGIEELIKDTKGYMQEFRELLGAV